MTFRLGDRVAVYMVTTGEKDMNWEMHPFRRVAEVVGVTGAGLLVLEGKFEGDLLHRREYHPKQCRKLKKKFLLTKTVPRVLWIPREELTASQIGRYVPWLASDEFSELVPDVEKDWVRFVEEPK